MSFCDECGNLLLPRKKNGKRLLFCKTCNREVKPGKEGLEKDYTLKATNGEHLTPSAHKVVETTVRRHITEDDRETFEDFFATGQE
ncbi:MAG: hypothetical protein Kow0069_36590 [Promethearchaeota archaeon]